MRITPLSNTVFGNSQPIKPKEEEKKVEEKVITSTEYSYQKEQEEKERRFKEEQIKKQQDWVALINKPQTYSKDK